MLPVEVGLVTRAPTLAADVFWEVQWGQLDARGVRLVRQAVIPGELLPRELATVSTFHPGSPGVGAV